MKQNIGRREFSQFPNLSQTNCQDDVSAYVQHLNALHTDLKTRFEDVLTMEIPQWIINPYGDRRIGCHVTRRTDWNKH
jgi:hypothetical protein